MKDRITDWFLRHPMAFGAAMGAIQGVAIGWAILHATRNCP